MEKDLATMEREAASKFAAGRVVQSL